MGGGVGVQVGCLHATHGVTHPLTSPPRAWRLCAGQHEGSAVRRRRPAAYHFAVVQLSQPRQHRRGDGGQLRLVDPPRLRYTSAHLAAGHAWPDSGAGRQARLRRRWPPPRLPPARRCRRCRPCTANRLLPLQAVLQLCIAPWPAKRPHLSQQVRQGAGIHVLQNNADLSGVRCVVRPLKVYQARHLWGVAQRLDVVHDLLPHVLR